MQETLERLTARAELVCDLAGELENTSRLREFRDAARALATDVALELNNSVGAILLSAELALRNLDSPDRREETKRSLRGIKLETLRCRNIIRAVEDALTSRERNGA
jgi:hypothetical protein